jgi:hypothetical protein
MKIMFESSKLKAACIIIYLVITVLCVPTITIDKTMELLDGSEFRKGLHYFLFLLSVNCVIQVSRINLKRRCFVSYSKSKSLQPSIWLFLIQLVIPSFSVIYFLFLPPLVSIICMPELPQVGGFFFGITIFLFFISLVASIDIPIRSYLKISSSLKA